MQRILDIDLDFFLDETAYWADPRGRLDPDEYPVWSQHRIREFLGRQCLLDGRLPGGAVTDHADVLSLWNREVQCGSLVPPFEVVHVDAHADLGLGDNGYAFVMPDLVHRPVELRPGVALGSNAVEDGNYLQFALAFGWVSHLTYVSRSGSREDVLLYVMRDFQRDADSLQLKGVSSRRGLSENLANVQGIPVDHLEPEIPFASVAGFQFQADRPFDRVYLAKSPAYTPPTADAAYDAIAEEFIEPAGGPSGHILG